MTTEAAEFLSEIIATATVTTLLLGVIGLLARNAVGEWLTGRIRQKYAIELENHRADIKAAGDVAVERLRAELQGSAAIAQLRCSIQYDKAAQAILGLHVRLYDAFDAVADYTSIVETLEMGSKADRRENVNNKMRDLRDFFRENRIYIPGKLGAMVKKLESDLFSAANHFSIHVERGDAAEQNRSEAWAATHKRLRDEVLPFLTLLEERFRGMLGIEEMFVHLDREDVVLAKRKEPKPDR